MPLPRYLPVKKKLKVEGPSLNELDDYCLSKIIGYALSLSSLGEDDSTVEDNGSTEMNLSLVSKRWYFLTQSQISVHGVHRINLDKITRNTPPKTVDRLAYAASARRPGVLMQKNPGANRSMIVQAPSLKANPAYCISMFRGIQPKLLKYKHIHIDGNLSCDEFKKLIVALNGARIEQLQLSVRIERDKTTTKEFSIMPKQLPYIERLSLHWNNEPRSDYSNGLTWTIYTRAIRLKKLEIHLSETVAGKTDSNSIQSVRDSIEKIAGKFLDIPSELPHHDLGRIIFTRTSGNSPTNCTYTLLVRGILMKEDSVFQVDTNDSTLIEDLIRSSSRVCTTHELRFLKFLSPIRNMEILSQLLRSKNLGTDYLSVVVDNVDQLDEVKQSMEVFRSVRHDDAICQLSLHIKDQKFPDCEEKIKILVQLSRLADVTIYVSAQQRVSIDCCHLMWSIGRALQQVQQQQSLDTPGRCLFKIQLQPNALLKQTLNGYSEITVPFGKYIHYRINTNREDSARHREILKSLKRDCYHQFVKSIRENVVPS